MNTFLSINLHQRGLRLNMIEIINHFKPKRHIQIAYNKDLILQEEIPNTELISFDFNEAQYGEYPNLLNTLPLDTLSIEHLKTIEGYCYLLMERLLHENYNEEYSRNHKVKPLNNQLQTNKFTPDYSFIDKKRFVFDNYRFLNHIISSYNIDLLFLSESTSTFIPYIAYQIAKKEKIKTVFTEQIPSSGNRVFTGDYTKIGIEVLKEVKEIETKYINREVVFDTDIYKSEWDRITNNTLPNYMKVKKDGVILKIDYSNNYKPSFIHKLKNLTSIDYLHYKFKGLNHSKQSQLIREYYEDLCSVPDLSSSYIYATLHLEPEKTSIPLGGDFGDQLLMIEMLSYHLPKDFFIFVKENPKQLFNYRSVRYYDRLNKMSNVKLISTTYSTFKLINKAKAVATLTGTVAYEAMSKGIPAFIFGHTVLQYFNQSWVVKTNQDCIDHMNKLKKENFKIDVKSFKIFFKALENIGTTLPFYNEVYIPEEEYSLRLKTEYINYINRIL